MISQPGIDTPKVGILQGAPSNVPIPPSYDPTSDVVEPWGVGHLMGVGLNSTTTASIAGRMQTTAEQERLDSPTLCDFQRRSSAAQTANVSTPIRWPLGELGHGSTERMPPHSSANHQHCAANGQRLSEVIHPHRLLASREVAVYSGGTPVTPSGHTCGPIPPGAANGLPGLTVTRANYTNQYWPPIDGSPNFSQLRNMDRAKTHCDPYYANRSLLAPSASSPDCVVGNGNGRRLPFSSNGSSPSGVTEHHHHSFYYPAAAAAAAGAVDTSAGGGLYGSAPLKDDDRTVAQRHVESRKASAAPPPSAELANGVGGQQHTGAHAPNAAHLRPIPGTPPKAIRLFVGRVGSNCDETQLRLIFGKFGVVESVVIQQRTSGSQRGYAFVRMASLSDADRAIRELNNEAILDESLGPCPVSYAQGEMGRLNVPEDVLSPSVDQVKLFVGSLPPTVTEEYLFTLFGQYGRVEEVHIMAGDGTARLSRVCAFVRLGFKEEGFHAIEKLDGKYKPKGGTRCIEVRFHEKKDKKAPVTTRAGLARQRMSFAQHCPMPAITAAPAVPLHQTWRTNLPTKIPRCPDWSMRVPASRTSGYAAWQSEMLSSVDPDRPKMQDLPPSVKFPHSPNTDAIVSAPVETPVRGPRGANVFVFHLPNDWREADLLTIFQKHGCVLGVRIATKNDPHERRKLGYGFVSFKHVESARAACEELDGVQVGKKRLKVQIKQGEEEFANPPRVPSPPAARLGDPPSGAPSSQWDSDFDAIKVAARRRAHTCPNDV